MKAQIIPIDRNKKDNPVVNHYESIKESYRNIRRPNGKPMSAQDKQFYNLLEQLTKTKKQVALDYHFLRQKLAKGDELCSLSTVKRALNNISLAFDFQFHNVIIQNDRKIFNKLLVSRSKNYENITANSLKKLNESRVTYKRNVNNNLFINTTANTDTNCAKVNTPLCKSEHPSVHKCTPLTSLNGGVQAIEAPLEYNREQERIEERYIAYSNIYLSSIPKERKKERKGKTDTDIEKPRIRIEAVSQRICEVKEEPIFASHSLGQASELGSSLIIQETKPALKPQQEASKPKNAKQSKTEQSAVCLTAEDEQQHYDLHKQRKASESSNGFNLIQFDQAEALKHEAPPEYQTYEDICKQHEEERRQQVIALHKQREIDLAEYNATANEKTPWKAVLDRFLEHDYTIQDAIIGERLVKKEDRELLINGFLKVKITIDDKAKHITLHRPSEQWKEWFNMNFKELFSVYFTAEGFSFSVS